MMNSPLLHYFIRLGLLLAGLYGLWSSLRYAATFVVKMRERTAKQNAVSMSRPAVIGTGRAAKARAAGSRLGIFILGAAAGIYGRDLWQFYHTRPLANVMVLQRHDDYAYRLQTEQGQAFEVTLCQDSLVDWEPGQKLKSFIYEQRKGCKSIHGQNLGFVAYTDARGNCLKF